MTVSYSRAGPLVTFYPCEHRVVCEDCARRVKKCLTCHVALEKRAAVEARTQEEKERLKSLEMKVQVSSKLGQAVVTFYASFKYC